MYDRFLNHPEEISLAIEIKLLDDEILDCADHEQYEKQAKE